MSTPFIDNNDLFETGSTGGMSRDLIDRIPKMRFSAASNCDRGTDSSCCSVCLQVSVILTCCILSICWYIRALSSLYWRRGKSLIPGFWSTTICEGPASVPAHIPRAVHRQLAPSAGVLPTMPGRCSYRPYTYVNKLAGGTWCIFIVNTRAPVRHHKYSCIHRFLFCYFSSLAYVELCFQLHVFVEVITWSVHPENGLTNKLPELWPCASKTVCLSKFQKEKKNVSLLVNSWCRHANAIVRY